jgi:hypothetical protein
MPTTACDCCGVARHDDPHGVPFSPLARHTGFVAVDQLKMISTDPRAVHGQAVIAALVGSQECLPDAVVAVFHPGSETEVIGPLLASARGGGSGLLPGPRQ